MRHATSYQVFLMLTMLPVAGLLLDGCVVPPPRAHVVAVAPARVWVPAHLAGEMWVRGHWRWR